MSAATSTIIAGAAIAAGAAGSVYSANKQSSTAKASQALQAQAMQQQSDLSSSIKGYADSRFKMADPALTAGMGYYTKLLSGDRGTVQGAIAPDVANVNAAYKGTQNYLDQQGVQGGARDNAIAESERSRVGQIGMLPFMARNAAAGNLVQAGTTLSGQGMAGLSGAASAASGAGNTAYNLNSQMFGQGEVRGSQISDLGSNIAGLYLKWMSSGGGGGSKGAGDVSSPFSVM